jgi:hypothetical protein
VLLRSVGLPKVQPGLAGVGQAETVDLSPGLKR